MDAVTVTSRPWSLKLER